MPVLGFDDFADVTENGRKIEPRHNRSVGISVDRGFLYINDNAFVTGCAGFSGAVMMSSGTEMFWGEVNLLGSQGETGLMGPTGAFGGPQGETGLGNFYQQSGFSGAALVPALMWNFEDETFYGFVTGLGGKWIQVSSGSLSGFTGLQGSTGVAGVTGAYGGPPGVTGLQGATGLQGTTGSQGVTGVRGTTGAVGLGATGLQGTTGSQGVTGVRGTTGAVGLGATGLQGATGVGGGSSEVFIGATGTVGFTGLYIPGQLSLPGGTVLFDYHIAINSNNSSVIMGFTGLGITSFYSNACSSAFQTKTYNSSLKAVTMGSATHTAPLIIIGTGYKVSSSPIRMIFGASSIVYISPGSYIRYRVL